MTLVKANNSERTEILFGQHDVLERWKQCAFNTRNEINIYADSSGSLETLGFKNYLEIIRSLKEKVLSYNDWPVRLRRIWSH